MKLAFSTNAFVKVPVVQAIERIGQIGFAGVEILADKPHIFPPSLSDRDVIRVRETLTRWNLSVSNINANTASGYFRDPSPEGLFEPSLSNPDEPMRRWRIEYTKRCVDFAVALHANNISVTSGRPLPGCNPDRGVKTFVESLQEIVNYAAARNVSVGIEYEPGLLVENARETLEVISRVGSPSLGVNLDIGHSVVAGEDPVTTISLLRGRIQNVHIEDIRGRKHYHLIPGEGEIDFEKVLGALSMERYTGFLTVELYTYPETPEEAARRSLEYLKRFVAQ